MGIQSSLNNSLTGTAFLLNQAGTLEGIKKDTAAKKTLAAMETREAAYQKGYAEQSAKIVSELPDKEAEKYSKSATNDLKKHEYQYNMDRASVKLQAPRFMEEGAAEIGVMDAKRRLANLTRAKAEQAKRKEKMKERLKNRNENSESSNPNVITNEFAIKQPEIAAKSKESETTKAYKKIREITGAWEGEE